MASVVHFPRWLRLLSALVIEVILTFRLPAGDPRAHPQTGARNAIAVACKAMVSSLTADSPEQYSCSPTPRVNPARSTGVWAVWVRRPGRGRQLWRVLASAPNLWRASVRGWLFQGDVDPKQR